MMSIRVAGSWKTITPYIGVAGAWVQVTGAWIGVGGVWESLTQPPLTATVSPTSLGASVSSILQNARPNVTTLTATVTPSGGSGTYSYAWSVAFISASSIDTTGTCSANSASSAATTFTGQTCDGTDSPGSDYYMASCVVTDTVSGAKETAQVYIQLTNNYVNPN